MTTPEPTTLKTPARKAANARWRPSLFKGILPLNPKEIFPNLTAGVTLAAMNIPQAMGYTKIAGTPVVTGLYTLLLPVIAFAVFGASRYLVVAADSATAAILAVGISPLAPAGSAHYLMLASMVALLTAGFLLVARILKLGFLADFLSRTVLIGFLTGVGFQVASRCSAKCAASRWQARPRSVSSGMCSETCRTCTGRPSRFRSA